MPPFSSCLLALLSLATSSSSHTLDVPFSPLCFPRRDNSPRNSPYALFLDRFAHLELFWKRGEFKEMAQLADHAIAREFPEIETKVLRGMSKGEAYCEMFEEMSRRMAKLVAEWLRVGYVQGNMNSDNTAIGGHTIDFGPFGIMEEYDPLWTPFTSDAEKKFSFAQQPQAGAVNIGVMHEAITALVEHVCEGDAKLPEYKKRIKETYRVGYAKYFHAENSKNRRAKLGLVNSGEVADGIWKELMRLMGPSVSGQVFIRSLTNSAILATSVRALLPPALSFSNFSLARTCESSRVSRAVSSKTPRI